MKIQYHHSVQRWKDENLSVSQVKLWLYVYTKQSIFLQSFVLVAGLEGMWLYLRFLPI
jgi:hypothetical protein